MTRVRAGQSSRAAPSEEVLCQALDTTRTVSVDPGDPTPPYAQLRRQFVGLIHSAALPDGARLPPLRQLAGDLGLAVGTVARAYRELEAAGLVKSRRGGGTRVTYDPPALPAAERR